MMQVQKATSNSKGIKVSYNAINFVPRSIWAMGKLFFIGTATQIFLFSMVARKLGRAFAVHRENFSQYNFSHHYMANCTYQNVFFYPTVNISKPSLCTITLSFKGVLVKTSA
ncbi:UNVERIFIED_CONTAM: hypothetical protein K2H54_046646 [Gekko kuhli]